MQFLNKNFFHFVSGFLFMIITAMAFIFVAGYYETEIIGKGKGIEASTEKVRSGANVVLSDKNLEEERGFHPDPRPARSLPLSPEYPPKLE